MAKGAKRLPAGQKKIEVRARFESDLWRSVERFARRIKMVGGSKAAKLRRFVEHFAAEE